MSEYIYEDVVNNDDNMELEEDFQGRSDGESSDYSTEEQSETDQEQEEQDSQDNDGCSHPLEDDHKDSHEEFLYSHEQSVSNAGHYYQISFGSREDMHPIDETTLNNFLVRTQDPFGVYSIRHNGIKVLNDFVDKPVIDTDFTEDQLQEACNQICKCLEISHNIPVIITNDVANAAFTPGIFNFTFKDDFLFMNYGYAQSCINNLHTTDTVLIDMAHEIGHALSFHLHGEQGTYLNEKIADFISGFVSCKMGVDIDAARKWFLMFYDPDGKGGYPCSEERWDITSAGYYFGASSSAEDLMSALKDPAFVDMINNYNSKDAQAMAIQEWNANYDRSAGYRKVMEDMITKMKKFFN